ncbi:MAG: cytochrome c [Rhodoferax sp.]|uniref:c-type cytochrome n=1 Tax=Rhodoferax sp. TaxID=50421 RepID=UPI0030193150
MLIFSGLLELWATTAWGTESETSRGAAIYTKGVLPSGALLHGDRGAGVGVDGMLAACITCHRASGLGTTEGRIVVPPIIGKYLLRPHSTNVQDMSLPHVAGYRSTRAAYTDETLAHAIREGRAPNGRVLNSLMPRFDLDDASMASLVAYLKTLNAEVVPGVSIDTLHFATIVTPDADPIKRKAMLDVMERFFADKNSFIRGGHRPMQANREIEYRVSRRWQLHVWQLTGKPDQWEQQLRAKLAAEPVFAVISGLAGRTWAPVHRFCQAAKLPCLLPNVELPVVSEGDFYPVYFSRGVLLEVDLMAGFLTRPTAEGGARPAARRVVQVFRQDDIGLAAAHALEVAAKSAGMVVENRTLPVGSEDRIEVTNSVLGLKPEDSLVLWLRPPDLAMLPPALPVVSSVLVSGTLGGLEQAPLTALWRSHVHMAYPFDLPEGRKVRMNFPLAWFKIKQLEVVSERVQTDTYIACGILAETLTDMLDSFVPDYLVERVEGMLSHRLVNGYYPHLSLAPGQRFASKGGYIVRFAATEGMALVQAGEWTTP